jgi:hypothetical protein
MVMDLLPVIGLSPALAAVVISTVAMFLVAVTFLVMAGRLRRANNRKAAVWAQLELHWGMAIDSIAHGAAETAALHERIRPADRVVLLDYLYKASVQETRAERRALYRELARPYIGVLERRARTGDPWQRARAIRTIAELAAGDGAAVITAGLDDRAPHVAMTAARVYAQLGLGTVHPLLERVHRYENWDRRLLRSVLVSFGPAAAPALHERLADAAASPHVRAVCADALAALQYHRAGDTAAVVLREETDVDLLAAALRLLRTPVTAAQRATVRGLCDAGDEVVRGQAVACLARVGEEADLAVVERALGDVSPWVVRSASRGLAARGAVAGAVAGSAPGAVSGPAPGAVPDAPPADAGGKG